MSFLITVCAETDKTGWVDPHDMRPVYRKEYYPYNDLLPIPEQKYAESCDSIESQSRSYLKRFINMILNAVHEDSFTDNKYKGHLIFEMDMEKFARLQEFTSNKFEDLHEVDLILSEILKKPPHAYLKEYFFGWCFKAFKALTTRPGIAGTIILSYLFVVYKLMKGNFNYWYIFKFLLINFLIFDIVFVWIRLYQVSI